MPKFPKNFGRRKSAANALESPSESSVEHSFKVFERPQQGGHTANPSFDGGVKFARTTGSADSQKEDNIFDGMKVNTFNRGSGASNSNTASTTDNSSRLSAASTAPSSMDTPGYEEWKSPHDRPLSDIPLPPVPKSSAGFSLKAAGRTLSWGKGKPATPSPSKLLDEPPSPTTRDEAPFGRNRAVTASSYASTATPPKIQDRGLDLSVGDDFGDMFAGMEHRRSAILDGPTNRGMSKSAEILPPNPATKSYSAARLNQPAPLVLDNHKQIEQAPYSWGSDDGLMGNTSPPPVVPHHQHPPSYAPPPVPRHGPLQQTDGNQARPRSNIQDSGLKRSSALSMRRQSALDFDEDSTLLQDSINASRRLNDTPPNPQVRKSWVLPKSTPEMTTKTQLAESEVEDVDLFEDADLAQRFQERSPTPPISKQAPMNKVMTPAQFERYKQDQERLRMVGGRPKDEENDEDEENYEDDEDEAEKNKKAAKQRRKQEAHMAVYRQQMMKVTGEAAPSSSLRPQTRASQSTPNLVLSDATVDGEEEDEEVPLAILAAHGFPNKNRPPTHRLSSMGSNPNLRGQAQAYPGLGGPLPVFARNLPQDPYVGAGLVHPSNRESLAFASGAGSVHGSAGNIPPPGGLVGVIATEERSRAMRRGSPNPQGGYGQMPPGGFGGMVPSPAMGQLGMGQLGMGQMNPMGQMPHQPVLTPGDQAQIRMTEQMQQFMQMQMQFMQMMTTNQSGQGVPPTGAPQLGPLGQFGPTGLMSQSSFGEIPRPLSQQHTPSQNQNLRPDSAIQQRTMSMLEPNGLPWMKHAPGYAHSVRAQGEGYAPSIAPSERSNIGLPGRYRPVSHAPVADTKSRTSATSMSGALQGWDSKHASTTIKTVQKVDNDDEDDDEGWAEMQKKREKKRSLWKSKKGTNGLSEMVGYTQ
ncbi:hypothetical protein ACMFMG_006984 [Clarireedia jacksonii]